MVPGSKASSWLILALIAPCSVRQPWQNLVCNLSSCTDLYPQKFSCGRCGAFFSFPPGGGRRGWGGGEGTGQHLHPHPNPPPSRGRELSQTLAVPSERRWAV